MSANESAFPDAGSQVAPPPAPPTTAAPPPSSASAPAPGSQPAPGTPAPGDGAAVSTDSGAQPHPQSPEAIAQQRAEAARARLAQLRSGQLGTQGDDDGARAEVTEPTAPPAPKEATEDQAIDAPPAAAEAAGDVDFENLDTVITEEQFRQRYRTPAKLAGELAARETQRKQLSEGVTKIGGEAGLSLAEKLHPLIFKQDPTEQDAEAFFDTLVLPEHAGARKLVTQLANHFVSTAIYDPDHGPGFASQLISEEWGLQPDGKTPYDLAFVDGLLKAHKAWGIGPDGKPVDAVSLSTLMKGLKANGITVEQAAKLFRAKKLGILAGDEYIDAELAEHPEEPERELTATEKEAIARADAAEAKLRETETSTEQKEAERKAAHDQKMGVYRTQARGWLGQYILGKVMPAALKANWAAKPGEEVSPAKKSFGRLISTTINHEIEHGATKDAYAGLMKMIDDGEAFDRNGQPTTRFLQAASPLQNAALALHNEFLRDLSPEMKFAASNTRNARLLTENGRNGQRPDDEQPPPIAQPRPNPQEESYEQARSRISQEYQAKIREAQSRPGTLR